MDLVSIVVPTYNHSEFILECLQSLLQQTYPSIEIIVVNDGSTDDTAQVLSTLTDKRLTIIHQKNKKLPGALNTGFSAATGDYLTWVSSDCYCEKQFVQELLAVLKKNKEAGLVYSNYFVFDQETSFVKEPPPTITMKRLLYSNCLGASFLYRRACKDLVGTYDEKKVGTEDWDYWLRVRNRFSFVYYSKPLYHFRRHWNTMSTYLDKETCRKEQDRKNLRHFSWKAFDTNFVLVLKRVIAFYETRSPLLTRWFRFRLFWHENVRMKLLHKE